MEKDSLQQKNNERSKEVLMELRDLRVKREEEKSQLVQKDIFLIITRDSSIFDLSLPAGRLIKDISSVVSELHIIYVGEKRQSPQKINDNTYIYSTRSFPFFGYFAAHQVVSNELVWRQRFLPTAIISIGDEIKIAKKLSRKYRRPLYVFHSFTKVFEKNKISINALVEARPKKIFVPNEYVDKIIKGHSGYNSALTETKIIPEYIDIPGLKHLFDTENITEEASLRNKIFSMIIFPRHANIRCFFIIKRISREISSSIKKFNFIMVVKPGQFLDAKILAFLFRLPITIHRENKDSIKLFQMSRFMLYFESPGAYYEPILYSFIAGCPVLSSGDEYSRVILFGSDFAEYNQLPKKGKTFGSIIKKLINDPYLYSKYKANCVGFTKTAFTHDHESYISLLRDNLNVHR